MARNVKANTPFFAFYSMALAHDVTDDIPKQVPYVPGKDRWMDYGEMIESMDDMVGKLVKKIDQLDLRDDTVILFTGDNGTAQRSKLRHIEGRKYEYEQVYSIRNGKRVPGGKGTLLDIGTNVPLIASWPGNIQAGSRGHELVDFSDWLPTLARLARAKPTQPHDGVSFTLHSSTPAARGAVIRLCRTPRRQSVGPHQTIQIVPRRPLLRYPSRPHGKTAPQKSKQPRRHRPQAAGSGVVETELSRNGKMKRLKLPV